MEEFVCEKMDFPKKRKKEQEQEEAKVNDVNPNLEVLNSSIHDLVAQYRSFLHPFKYWKNVFATFIKKNFDEHTFQRTKKDIKSAIATILSSRRAEVVEDILQAANSKICTECLTKICTECRTNRKFEECSKHTSTIYKRVSTYAFVSTTSVQCPEFKKRIKTTGNSDVAYRI